MGSVGQIEKKTQQRVVALFRDTLGYDYLGNWIDRDGQPQHRAGAAARLAEQAGRRARR